LKHLISVVLVFLIACTFLISNTYAKWAYAFVVNNGNIYVVSETHIESNKIGKKIGEVTKYSDQEGTYSGNFSNQFPKGTEYYEIKGVKTNEFIGIKESKDSFIKAKYHGKYAGSVLDYLMILVYFIGIVLFIGVIYLFLKKRKSR
jgi:hypothetical protein